MAKKPTLEDVDLVLTEAEWMARLQEGALGKDLSVSETKAYREWLNEDPENPNKLDACFDAWALSKNLENSSEIMALLGEDVPEKSEGDTITEPPVSQKEFRWVYSVVAACLAIVILPFIVFYSNGTPDRTTHYQTGIGEQTVYTLSDGSRVQMNTDTHISLNFTAENRELHLLRGEATFDVVHDPDRPFDVLSGKGRARAIGTRFNVFNDGEKVTVSVIEGIVQVARAEDVIKTSKAIGPKLLVGQQMSYNKQGDMSEVKIFDIQKIQAWQKGRLEFFDASLGEVVLEMNRYSPMSIMVGDDSLFLLKVSGIFDVKEPEKMLEGLTDILPIKVLINNNKLILIRVKKEENNHEL
ncbi:MAG: hypothetical protein COB36_15035 [Alphaproteobacteria bacterium]|nr:MAG: hypothetical protein COB36_15035 [Alphaproteobacteria bacterium]